MVSHLYVDSFRLLHQLIGMGFRGCDSPKRISRYSFLDGDLDRAISLRQSVASSRVDVRRPDLV